MYSTKVSNPRIVSSHLPGSSAKTARSQTQHCHQLWRKLGNDICNISGAQKFADLTKELVFNDHRVKAAGRRSLASWPRRAKVILMVFPN